MGAEHFLPHKKCEALVIPPNLQATGDPESATTVLRSLPSKSRQARRRQLEDQAAELQGMRHFKKNCSKRLPKSEALAKHPEALWGKYILPEPPSPAERIEPHIVL